MNIIKQYKEMVAKNHIFETSSLRVCIAFSVKIYSQGQQSAHVDELMRAIANLKMFL